MRWMLMAALALAGCKKEKTDTAPAPAPAAEAAPTPAPAEPATPPEEAAAKPADPAPGGEGAAASPDPAAEPAAKKPIVAVGSDGKTKVLPMSSKVVAETAEYTIKLSAPAQATKGADATATVEVTPKAGWKLNKEFPTKLTVSAPADVTLKKPVQEVKDAVAFADKAGKWSFEFKTSAAGDKAFGCKMKFAVCTDTTCDPKKEDLAWNVSVE